MILPRSGARVLLFALTLLTAACSARAPAYAPKDGAEPQLLLWRAVHRESGATAHILGSIHVGDGPLVFDPAITEALATAPTLLVEIDSERIADGAGEMLAAARLSKKLRLWNVVPPETYERVQSALRSFGMPEHAMDPFAPWFVHVFLNSQAAESAGFLGVYGVDNQIMERARPSKQIVALETAELQTALFADNLTDSVFAHKRYEQQVLVLEESLDLLPEAPDAIRDTLAMWKMGDDAALGELLTREIQADPRLEERYQKVVTDRNIDMAAKVENRLAKGEDVFVVVGAAHVIGTEGIPALLAGRGHEVDRVAPQPTVAPTSRGPTASTFEALHHQLTDAIASRNGRAASERVSRSTLRAYEEALDHAIASEGWVVKSLPPAAQARVLAFRIHAVTKARAHEAGGAYALTVKRGWQASDEENVDLTYSAPVIAGSTAQVPVKAPDSTGVLILTFHHEAGEWRLDVARLESRLDPILREAARSSGVDASSLILEATAAAHEVDPDPALWEPTTPQVVH